MKSSQGYGERRSCDRGAQREQEEVINLEKGSFLGLCSSYQTPASSRTGKRELKRLKKKKAAKLRLKVYKIAFIRWSVVYQGTVMGYEDAILTS